MKKVYFSILFFCLMHIIKSILFLILAIFYENFFSFTRDNFIEISFVAKILPVIILLLFLVIYKIKKYISLILSITLYELTIYSIGSFFNIISKSIVINNIISMSLFIFIFSLLIFKYPALKRELTK